MILSEAGASPAPTPPLDAFKAHLRLAHGFADDTAEDALLGTYLANAISAVEHRTGLALIARRFALSVSRWDRDGCLRLPVGPASAIVEAAVETAAGSTAIDTALWSLEAGTTRQRLSAGGAALPAIPVGGRVRIVFDAGLAADWSAMPGDLFEAVTLLAAHFYARRGTEQGIRRDDPVLPGPVTDLLAPRRAMRL
ncbi:MAG: hypothetical protein AAF074_06230 [Pseudomonadota bacterium]